MSVRSDVTIDWSVSPRVIEVAAPSTEITIQDLIDTLRYLEYNLGHAMSYGKVVNSAGKTTLDATSKTIITLSLQDAQLKFEDRPPSTFVKCYVRGGNIVAVDDLGIPSEPILESDYTQVNYAAATTGAILAGSAATAGEVADAVWDEDLTAHDTEKTAGAAQQAASYNNTVVIDSINGVSGTAWPIGTHGKPVDNLTDALTIMAARSIDKIRLHTDLTIEASHNIDGKLIETMGIMGTTITFQTGCSANNAAIRYADVEGVITNGDVLLIESCQILDLANFSGIMNVVAFAQGAEIGIGYWATIIQATSGGTPTNEPELNIGTAAVNISHYTGNLKLISKTGSDRTVINCSSGNILIDSTCIAGIIQLLGVGVIESDNSGVGCQVDSDGFISAINISDEVWANAAALRVLGLMQENQFIDQTSYDSNNHLTAARIRLYDNASSVGTGSDVIATYNIVAVWTDDEMDSYSVKKA